MMRPPLPWFSPSSPSRFPARPWLSERAITFLENLLRPDFEVLEHGSGGDTIWLADRVKHVTSYETNVAWVNALLERVPDNVTIKRERLPNEGDKTFDLLVIDGEPVEDRAAWLLAAVRLVKPGGYVLLDNANRPEYAEARKSFRALAQLLECVNANGGVYQYLVTEFYRVLE